MIAIIDRWGQSVDSMHIIVARLAIRLGLSQGDIMNMMKLFAISVTLLALGISGNARGQIGTGTAIDSMYQSKGDQKRSYRFPKTGQMIPYRTYVPTTWTPGMKLPLVVALHGGGLDENAPFDRSPAPLKNELQKLSEEFQFIVVSPLGYTMSGGFGSMPPPGAPGGARRTDGAGSPPASAQPAMAPPKFDPQVSAYSVEDVMNVVAIVEKEYGVDTTKEFLTGNSMGGIGTMFLAAKYPKKWLAIAPSEAGFDPARYGKDKYGAKGALLIHKQDDNAPQVETESAEMVKILDAEGVDARTISVPWTVHENVWFFTLPTTFHFFDKYVHPPVERMGPGPAAGPGVTPAK
jgi:poly(3-hydroxybutyrate) depolymerase